MGHAQVNDITSLIAAIGGLIAAIAAVLSAWHATQANNRTKDIKADTKVLREAASSGESQTTITTPENKP